MLHTFVAFIIRGDRTVLIDTCARMFRRLYLPICQPKNAVVRAGERVRDLKPFPFKEPSHESELLDRVTLNSFSNPQSSMPNVYYKKKG
ncbi:hypothetical protein NSTC745_04388 [Nostoc sp. DSM 114161]